MSKSLTSLDLPLDQVLTSSAFNLWLQVSTLLLNLNLTLRHLPKISLKAQYLPSDFKYNDNRQDNARIKRWYKFIKFDINEFSHLFSIAILVIWVSSLLIFAIYLSGPCSPLVSPIDSQVNISLNHFQDLNNISVRFISPIGSGLYRAHQILMENVAQSNEDNYDQIEENLGSCIVMAAYGITNISLATLLLFHLFFYIIHVVEHLQIFPWFAIEIALSAIFVIVTFVFNVVLCIISAVYTTEMIVTLGILQSVFGLIFCEFHFRQNGKGHQFTK